MFSWLANAWRVPELRRRVLFTAMILAVYRLGSWIPAPGVNSETIENYFSGRGDTILGLLNLFSGGALSQFSLFALGIMPYVTASIILQLLTVVIPRLGELQKEGEAGYAKITQYTRYLTVVLAAAQATGYAFLFRSQGALDAGSGELVLIIVTLTAGTTLLMWMGELITKRGIGNGISILIFASILVGAPIGIAAWWNGGPMEKLFYPLIALGDRRGRRLRAGGPAPDPDPVREAHGRPPDDGRRLDLPAAPREHGGRHPDHLRGRDPRVPADDGAVLPGDARLRERALPAGRLDLPAHRGLHDRDLHVLLHGGPVQPGGPVGQPPPHGGYIPGIRPGPPTAQYLDRVLSRLTLPGALFLALVAVLPSLFIAYGGFSQASAGALGGTSVLIAVGVALDTMRQMESQMMMRSYEGFLQ